MRSVRVVLRLSAVLLVTAAVFVIWTIGRPFSHLGSRGPERWRAAVYRTWSRCMCHILGVRLEVGGPLPPAPCLVVCNHLGYLDIPVLASRLGAVFVSKAEVRRWPAIGYLANAFGTIFVKREEKRDLPLVNARIEAALDRGDRVVLFPEGTSTGGDAVGRFKPSLLEPAAGSRYPVYCAALSYRTPPGEEPASEVVCWWRDMEFVPHLKTLLGLPHFRAALEFAPEALRSGNRKDLAERTWQAVSRMHTSLP